ncbi:MAG TPA: RNA polymerase sigma factor [Pyrinomonadaceae bacterium]|nr:RNA polymerase sigma factor [Pyrinomonadaceae bacterium]HMP65469.1 RNA polymerase sigma factor [Pyrinomonadaceae bacterium]
MNGFPNILHNEPLISRSGEHRILGGPICAEMTDAQLVEAVLAGDNGAFEKIFDRYKRQVATVAGRFFKQPEQIEEIVQVSFTKAYAELPGFRGRYELSLASWLVRIAANTSIDQLRARSRKPEQLSCELSQDDAEALHSFADARVKCNEEAAADRDLARKLLARLNADDRALLEMLYVDELSVAEIGDIFGWSPSKVKVRAWRARRSLRKLVKRFV